MAKNSTRKRKKKEPKKEPQKVIIANPKGAVCGQCGTHDQEGIKTAVIKKYMELQIEYRKLIKLHGNRESIPRDKNLYCTARNEVLTEFMDEFGLRRDVKKPLRPV